MYVSAKLPLCLSQTQTGGQATQHFFGRRIYKNGERIHCEGGFALENLLGVFDAAVVQDKRKHAVVASGLDVGDNRRANLASGVFKGADKRQGDFMLQDILSGMNMVAEGVYTSLSAYQLAAKVGVETPIINEVYRVLYEDKSPQTALTDLMVRALKAEN